MKKLLLTSTVLAGMVITPHYAYADETVTTNPQEQKTTLQSLEETTQSLKKERTSIRLQLEKLKSKDDAKVQKLNVKSQLDACDIKLENAEKNLQAEKDRIEEEKKRIAEEKRVAEEKRIAEEKRQQVIKDREEAYRKATPIPSSTTVKYTPTSNSYSWGQCTWGVKVLAPWVGDYWGNATQWSASAAAQGFRVGNAPVAGSVIVFHDGYYGHVAYVTDVRADGAIQVLEANYGGTAAVPNPNGIGNYRGWFQPGGNVSYIYPND